jgi:hypothetical protein
MKNKIKFKAIIRIAGIIAIAAVIGFSLIACGGGGGGGGGSKPPPGSGGLKAPTGFTAEAVSSSEIHLKWSAVSGAAGYKIYGSLNSTSGFELLGTRSTNSASHSYLDPDTTYYYKVAAVSANDTEGPLSNTVSALTLSGVEKITGGGSGSKNSNNTYWYRLYTINKATFDTIYGDNDSVFHWENYAKDQNGTLKDSTYNLTIAEVGKKCDDAGLNSSSKNRIVEGLKNGSVFYELVWSKSGTYNVISFYVTAPPLPRTYSYELYTISQSTYNTFFADSDSDRFIYDWARYAKKQSGTTLTDSAKGLTIDQVGQKCTSAGLNTTDRNRTIEALNTGSIWYELNRSISGTYKLVSFYVEP